MSRLAIAVTDLDRIPPLSPEPRKLRRRHSLNTRDRERRGFERVL